MKILGFIETSFLDWEGKLSSVIFVGGCNFNCPFCQNYPLVKQSKKLKEFQWQDISKRLTAKKHWIDGVVISGGEPMMHPEIFELLANIKQLGLATKIDTNGFYPYPLKSAIEHHLVDYVAMDIKTTLDKKYDIACGRKIFLEVIERTIKLLKESGVDYEFRTTLVPTIVCPDDLIVISEKLAPVKRYALQQFVPANARLMRFRKLKPYTKKDIELVLPTLKKYCDEVILRGF
ncbi:MAG: anaerobic ribonucleoside-triphosphate reductase activating protein [candidate division WOR-3 bacterium]